MLTIVANLKYYSDNTEQIIEKQVKNKTFWEREEKKKKDDNKY